MSTEMGEYLVGAYLKLIEGCDFVDYNVRTPGGGLAGLNELDVVGIHFDRKVAYLCEVTTHVRGLLYGDNPRTVERVRKKYQTQQDYAKRYLSAFRPVYMFWSPVVPQGFLTNRLSQIEGLELVINGQYKERIKLLIEKARKEKQDVGNPAFRVIQIIEAMRA